MDSYRCCGVSSVAAAALGVFIANDDGYSDSSQTTLVGRRKPEKAETSTKYQDQASTNGTHWRHAFPEMPPAGSTPVGSAPATPVDTAPVGSPPLSSRPDANWTFRAGEANAGSFTQESRAARLPTSEGLAPSAGRRFGPPPSVGMTPVFSATVRSAPMDSATVRSAPMDSAPVRSAPMDSAPVRSAPTDDSASLVSAQVGSAPMDSATMVSASNLQTNDAIPMGELVLASPMLSAMTNDSYLGMPLPPSGHVPPPVCNELVLPHCEACFSVALYELDSITNGDINLFGMSGKPLLRASVDEGPDFRKLSISMKPKRSPKLGSIEKRHGRGPLQIRSKKEELYGDLIPVGEMSFVLSRTGTDVLRVNFDTERNQLVLTSAQDNGSLAVAMRSETSDLSSAFQDVPHLDVHVNPGVDAVLALLCALGIILFAADTSPPVSV